MEVSRRAATILALRIIWRSKLMVRFCFIASSISRTHIPRVARIIRIPRMIRTSKKGKSAPLQLLKQRRTELAGSEVVEGAEASGEFGGVQVALAVEAAEKIVGGLFSFLRIAFYAARHQVAVGIAPQPRPRHDVVQALDCRRGVTQAVEALVALARAPTSSSLAAARLSMRFSLTVRISSGSRTSTTCPNLLRCTRRKAPWATRRRTPARTDPVDARILRPSHRIENRRRRFPSRRLCRKRCA